MGKILFKGENDNPDDTTEYMIDTNKPVHKPFVVLRHWSLKDLRKIYTKHVKNNYPILINKFQFRTLLGLDKNISDYVYKNLTKCKDLNHSFFYFYSIFSDL